MRKIEKSAEPESLQKYKKMVKNNDWNLMHKNNHEVYDDILFQCLIDQKDVCGYTEVKLNDRTHIDHFIKRDIDPTQTFVWDNMIAAVHDSKFGSDFKDKTVSLVDYDKIRVTYHHILSPVRDNVSNRFHYMTNGMIEPADVTDTDACETIRFFNLNEGSLVTRRKEAMKAVRDCLDGGMTKEEIYQYLDEFPSAVAYEINQYELLMS